MNLSGLDESEFRIGIDEPSGSLAATRIESALWSRVYCAIAPVAKSDGYSVLICLACSLYFVS